MKPYIVLFLSFCFVSLSFKKNEDASTEAIQVVLLKKINDYRLKNHKKTLILEDGLSNSAQNQCDYLFKIGKLSHEQPDKKYRTTKDRIKFFSTKTFLSFGENCLKTYANLSENQTSKVGKIAEDMFQLWRTSKPHNENLLNQRFTHTGFGFHTNSSTEEIYCVMDYGGN